MDFYVTIIIHTVVGLLAASVKNPNSNRAKAILAHLDELRNAIDEFQAIVKQPKKSEETVLPLNQVGE
jgi:hypothetical protein